MTDCIHDIELTDHLIPMAPPRSKAGNGEIRLTLALDRRGLGTLRLSSAAYRWLGEPQWLRVKVSRSRIAVTVTNELDPHARRVKRGSKDVTATDLAALFDVRPGERWPMPGVVADTTVTAPLANTLFTRYGMRRKRGAA